MNRELYTHQYTEEVEKHLWWTELRRLSYEEADTSANFTSIKNSTYTISDILYIRQDGDCDGLFLFWVAASGLKGSFDCN